MIVANSSTHAHDDADAIDTTRRTAHFAEMTRAMQH